MYDETRFALIKELAKGTCNRQNTSANLIRSAKDCVTRAEKFGAPEMINAWLKEGGREKTQTTGRPTAIRQHEYCIAKENW